jgi:hypothetical protein
MALTVLATGLNLPCGSILPVILPVLRSGAFLARLHKGRLSTMVATMLVSLGTGGAALIGTAAAGFRQSPSSSAAHG